MRVAIVDDTPDVRLLVRRSLELDPDIDVVAEAADGRAAIEIAAQHRPEVMLLDLAMPVMDGLQALPHVVEASPDTAVVVLSGFSATAMAEQAMAAGARGFVQKGIPAQDLRARVRHLCGRPAAERPSAAAPAPVDPPVPPEAAEVEKLRSALARTAHELRSPVTVISGLVALAGQSASLPEEQRRETEAALLRQTEVLQRLAGDLETAVQSQRGSLLVELQDVEVTQVVRSAVAAAGMEGSVDVLSDPVVVARADPSRLTQIVTNLLTNAAKYADPPYEVHVARAGDEAVVSVADRGDGVPEAFRPLLFEEYTRARDDGRGTGLGLFVVRSLAEAQGGSVDYQPRLGGGSLFTVRLRGARPAQTGRPDSV